MFRRKTPEEKAAEERERQLRKEAEERERELQREAEEVRRTLEAERARRIQAAQDAIDRFYKIESPKQAPKWEYYCLTVERTPFLKRWVVKYAGRERSASELSEILAELGSQGWELTGVSSFVNTEKPAMSNLTFTYTDQEFLYFKRPRPSLPAELMQALEEAEAYGRGRAIG